MKKLLVFTDLDGTLLNHNTYGFEEAIPAINKLKENNFPLIINSSKTIAEIKLLQSLLQCDDPFIAENGTCIYFNNPDGIESIQEHVLYFGQPYAEIIQVLHDLRDQYGYCFRGFNDIDVDELSVITSLSLSDSNNAKTRHASEPVIWEDSNEKLDEFRSHLLTHHLQLTKGGRFYHVMSQTDKAEALNYLSDYYRGKFPDVNWVTMSLGDSFNDIAMLNQTEISVLIKNPDTLQPSVEDIPHIIKTEKQSSAAWNDAVLQTINTLSED